MTVFRRALKIAGYGLGLLIGLPLLAFAIGVLWPLSEVRPPPRSGADASTRASSLALAPSCRGRSGAGAG